MRPLLTAGFLSLLTLSLGCGGSGSTPTTNNSPASSSSTTTPPANSGSTTTTPPSTGTGTGNTTNPPNTGSNPGNKKVIGYFVSWGVYGRDYHVKNIVTSGSADKLTHINFAFANIGSDYKVTVGDPYADLDKYYSAADSVDGVSDTWNTGVLRGSFHQLKKLKAIYPEIKLLISVGGWTWSDKFSQMAMTQAGRATFIQSCIDIYIKGQFSSTLSSPGLFDGIDIDWEYPGAAGNTNNYSPEDTGNFTKLLSELRTALDTQGAIDGKQYLLTIAAPGGEAKFEQIEIGNIHPYLDFINLMTYDFHGAWGSTTNFHSALKGTTDDPTWSAKFWADNAIEAWLAGGVPPEKLVLGVPFYGRGWTGVSPGPNGDGLFQAGSGAAPGTYEAGMEDYKVLKDLIPTYNSYFHSEAEAFWIYDSGTGIFWSFDDTASMTNKMNYIKANDLGGAMFWELSGDDAQGSLIEAIDTTLNN